MQHAFSFFVGEDDGFVIGMIDGFMFTEIISTSSQTPHVLRASRCRFCMYTSVFALSFHCSSWLGPSDQREKGGGKGGNLSHPKNYIKMRFLSPDQVKHNRQSSLTSPHLPSPINTNRTSISASSAILIHRALRTHPTPQHRPDRRAQRHQRGELRGISTRGSQLARS